MVELLLVMLFLPIAASAETPHVRTTDAQMAQLIAQGQAHSASFRALVDALNRSDVIVYVEPRIVRVKLGGYLIHRVFEREGYRYLRVVVSTPASENKLIEVVAHELQHALEVATAPAVRRPDDIASLFQRIGFRDAGCPRRCYETLDAIHMGRRVREEFRQGGM
jgi:hypothetical protein